MNIEEFKTLGEWYTKMKDDDFIAPLSLYRTLAKNMKDEHISFHDAYKQLQDEGRINVVRDNSIENYYGY